MSRSFGIIDSHAHVAYESYKDDQAEVIARAFESGVEKLVQAGVDLETIDELLTAADTYSQIYVGIGLHPHEAKHWNEESANKIRQAAKHPKVVAIGECGLDFYYNYSEKETQIEVFRKQIQLAVELDKPLIVHTRDAWEETFELLECEGKGKLRGVFHCFTGNAAHLPKIYELGFYVSFSGILTFNNAKDIQEAARQIKDEFMLVETDCPYLTPVPHRGKRNEPSYVWFVAEKLATLRNEPLEEVARKTRENTCRLFGLT